MGPKEKEKAALAAISRGNAADLAALLAADDQVARSGRVMVAAGGRGDAKLLALLLDAGGDPNGAHRQYRPLHALIQETPHVESRDLARERLEALQLLLAHGADPDLTGAWPEMRAVIVAAFSGTSALVGPLLEAGARRDVFVDAALGSDKAVQKWLSREPGLALARDVGSAKGKGLTALHCAAGSKLGGGDDKARRGLLSCVRVLVDAGSEIDAVARSWSHDVAATYFAVHSQDVEKLGLLLGCGANPNRALVAAAWGAPSRMAELCIERGAQPDASLEKGRPVLNELIRWGQVKPAKWLLSKGASPNVPDARGWTAVHQAASRGNEGLLRAVLEAGGDLRARNEDKATPLEVAMLMGRKKIIMLLQQLARA